MSPAHTPWSIPKRFSARELAQMREMSEREDDNMDATAALGECVKEIERLYEAAVAECYVEQPLPKIDDLQARDIYSLTQTKVTILARRVDRNEWMGIRAKSIHAMIGKSKEQVKDYLDRVVGE